MPSLSDRLARGLAAAVISSAAVAAPALAQSSGSGKATTPAAKGSKPKAAPAKPAVSTSDAGGCGASSSAGGCGAHSGH